MRAAENSVGGKTASGADVGMAMTFKAAFLALPSRAYALASGFDDECSVGVSGKGVMFAIPGLFCWAFDDRHGVGVNATTDGTWGEWVVGVEVVLGVKGLVVLVIWLWEIGSGGGSVLGRAWLVVVGCGSRMGGITLLVQGMGVQRWSLVVCTIRSLYCCYGGEELVCSLGL